MSNNLLFDFVFYSEFTVKVVMTSDYHVSWTIVSRASVDITVVDEEADLKFSKSWAIGAGPKPPPPRAYPPLSLQGPPEGAPPYPLLGPFE